jgi:hypothetical protein
MWKFVGESVMGSAHRLVSLPCQDANAIRYEPGSGTLIAVGSDGAGSASHSQLGSEIVCREIICLGERYLLSGGQLNVLAIETARDWVAHLQQTLDDAAVLHGVHRRELAATMLVALIGLDCGCFLQIGDGAMVFAVADHFEIAFWPQSGEYVNTTMFVTDANAFQSLQFKTISAGIDGISVFTDGLERLVLKFQDKTVHAPFFSRMFQAVDTLPQDQLEAELRLFLNSEAVNARTDDDKTLILACRNVGKTNATAVA